MSEPDGRLSAAHTWLFDLDNTLHDASAHIFPHIGRAMHEYMRRHLQLDEAAAITLRQHYWRRYGATLLGLMRHHAVDPHHFLSQTHQFPDLAAMLVANRGLPSMLRRLPGRKLIVSNAPLHYTRAILSLAGIASCFDAVYSIERLHFQPKPATAGFLRVLRAEGLDPRRCIMVEDTLPNLRTAKRLGMTSVWVDTGLRKPPYVDIRIGSVMALPQRVRGL